MNISGFRGVFRDMSGASTASRFRRLIALGLTISHAAFLSVGSSLHRAVPDTTGIDIVDLPAEYHQHDFRLVAGGETPVPPHEDCLVCLLQRTVGPPPEAVSGLHDGATGAIDAGPPLHAPPPVWRYDPLSRAPPV